MQSIAISGRSPLKNKLSLKNSNRRKFNITVKGIKYLIVRVKKTTKLIEFLYYSILGNKLHEKKLSDADSIALASVIVDLFAALLATGGAATISLGGLALLAGFNPLNLFNGAQSSLRSSVSGFVQGDFTSCTAASGDLGYCASIMNCNSNRGIASGICPNGGVCCTSKLSINLT